MQVIYIYWIGSPLISSSAVPQHGECNMRKMAFRGGALPALNQAMIIWIGFKGVLG